MIAVSLGHLGELLPVVGVEAGDPTLHHSQHSSAGELGPSEVLERCHATAGGCSWGSKNVATRMKYHRKPPKQAASGVSAPPVGYCVRESGGGVRRW